MGRAVSGNFSMYINWQHNKFTSLTLCQEEKAMLSFLLGNSM